LNVLEIGDVDFESRQSGRMVLGRRCRVSFEANAVQQLCQMRCGFGQLNLCSWRLCLQIPARQRDFDPVDAAIIFERRLPKLGIYLHDA
jgi:hypothetical protein